MDQVTQQNAAMVEQTTAASHELGAEAVRLADLVGRFQLGRAQDPSASSHAQARLRLVGG